MKPSNFIILFNIILWMGACSKEPAQPTQPTQPTPKLPTPVGEGVEIYRARLEWEKNSRGRNVRVKAATLLEQTPLVKYDEIVAYYMYKPGQFAGNHWLFDLTKVVNDLPGGSSTFGYPTLSHATASDTGLCVTVDKQVIYAGMWGHLSTLYYEDLIFRMGYETKKQNSVEVAWDSVYSFQGQPPIRQTGPDPRYNPVLLNRLRKDGKLRL